ncbi:hypothetical protein IC007_1943 [Sulfuracidifex tepidarius]|uniref:Uncharacterized protein n=2 Tax=Sulfuracidifex tepidarius TaxID=1294262 RepID=A0A510E4G9_9CREN|nr:hypothetical protein IC007_1943 [Sulfuracidifex tepidarius]
MNTMTRRMVEKERCGIIMDDEIIEIENIATNDHEFICDYIKLYSILKDRGVEKLKALFHTHLSGICYPSEKDIENMNVWKEPWIIVGRNCIEGFILHGSVVKIDVNSFLSQELYDRLVKLLH